MNKNILLILLLSSLSLFAYSDYDLDGVDDKIDQCPNTPFSDLVDINGCSIQSIISPHNFDIIFGIDLSQTNYDTMEKTDLVTETLQADYYYKNFSLQAATSYHNSDSDTYSDSGLGDSFLAAYYKITPTNELDIRLGLGVILPTYDTDLNNNNADYTASLNFSYMFDDMNLFGGYSHTIINDDDVNNVAVYQDTDAYSLGLGFYPAKQLYISGAYNSSESIYAGVEDIETLSLYAFYNIDQHWFASFTYSLGVSDTASDNSISLRLGYYF